jgi:hypothetical protein
VPRCGQQRPDIAPILSGKPHRVENVRSSATCCLVVRPMPGQARSRCSAGSSLIGCPPRCRVCLSSGVPPSNTVAGRFGTDNDGYRRMLEEGRRRPDRVWAAEGCNGVGKHLAQRLVLQLHLVIIVL